jgi:hypothetical protein
MCVCGECKYWQGRRRWGDCYRVVFHIVPELKECTTDYGGRTPVPFDPNDALNYYKFDSRFHKLYKLARSGLPRGVRCVKYKGKYFFQTNEYFSCGECYEPN